MSDIAKYFDQIKQSFPGHNDGDIRRISEDVDAHVARFLTSNSFIQEGSAEGIYAANKSMAFDTALGAVGVEGIQGLITSCGISNVYARPCMENIVLIMDRYMGSGVGAGASGAWLRQNRGSDRSNNNLAPARPLSSIYSDNAVKMFSNAAPSAESFGVNIDMAIPDMKVAITVAIMSFHTRLVPRILPTRVTSQPNVSYTKTHLEVFDMVLADSPRKMLLDLYADPSFARNELQKIVPRTANEPDQNNFQFLAEDGILLFNKNFNLLKLSLQANVYGHTEFNRTDLIAENVKFEKVYVTVKGGQGSTPETFEVLVPASVNRLTRMVNASDSAMRNANITFRAPLTKNSLTASGGTSTLLAGFTADEQVVLEFNLKPTVSLKFGTGDSLGAVSARLRHVTDNDLITGGETAAFNALSVALYGFSLDARFSEENVRKTNIAVTCHRQPFSFDIPIGRNYVYDYAISQDNAEENASNLTKVIGIGQDDVALSLCIKTLEEVYTRIQGQGNNAADPNEYIGREYIAGDKVKPTVFQGVLDFSKLNIIRDADRSGDIKQKAINYLTAVTSKILQESFFLQQLGANNTLVWRAVTSMEILGNIFCMPHIHDHMNKETIRELGDGIEYALCLPNGQIIEFVTSTFNYMREQLVAWPIIKNDAESELNFAHNWDYGNMIAHYTPSGQSAHHRLFSNIRELPLVTNPVGLIIDIAGMAIVNGIAQDSTLRPVVAVEGNITVAGTLTTDPTPAEGGA